MKKTHIIGLVVIALGVGFLIKMLSSEFSRYETFESDYAQAGKEINVVGELEKEMEMYYNPHKDANYFSFYLKDDAGVTKKVVYKGIKPRDFERSEKVVVIGKLEDDAVYCQKNLNEMSIKICGNRNCDH
jgi:cytochrome c-type biogenesis protein CcmE